MFLSMIAPWETEDAIERAEARFRKIKIPFYTGSGAYAYTYKLHWLGAQNYFRNIDAPKKLLFTGPAHLERPYHQLHDEIIRWYDHWLKGIDNGVMHEERCGTGSWEPTSGGPPPIGRCPTRSGRDFISAIGVGCRRTSLSRQDWPVQPLLSPTFSPRCRSRRQPRWNVFAT